MVFQHEPLEKIELERTTTSEGRVYTTPDGDFRSVTTFLSDILDQSWLEAWEERVGKDKAGRIRTSSANRGTEVHEIIESYVSNDPNPTLGRMPLGIEMFKKVKPVLDRHVEKVYAQEFSVWNKDLKLAGTLDLFCNFLTHDMVVDFKTSAFTKAYDWMDAYYYQSALYSLMVGKMYDRKLKYFSIIVVPEVGKPQVVIKRVDKYLMKLLQLRGIKNDKEFVGCIMSHIGN